MEYSIEATDEQVEILGTVKAALCEEHFGQLYVLPDGTETDNDGLKAWLLAQGIDIEAPQWTWWMDFIDACNHCESDEAFDPEPTAGLDHLPGWLQDVLKQDPELVAFIDSGDIRVSLDETEN